MAVMLGGVEIPGVYVQETSSRYIGGDIRRAVDGTPHSSPVREIRTWRLETRVMPYANYLALRDVYKQASSGQIALHLGESEGFVMVYIREFTDDRSLIPDGDTNSMRTVRIVVEEA